MSYCWSLVWLSVCFSTCRWGLACLFYTYVVLEICHQIYRLDPGLRCLLQNLNRQQRRVISRNFELFILIMLLQSSRHCWWWNQLCEIHSSKFFFTNHFSRCIFNPTFTDKNRIWNYYNSFVRAQSHEIQRKIIFQVNKTQPIKSELCLILILSWERNECLLRNYRNKGKSPGA